MRLGVELLQRFHLCSSVCTNPLCHWTRPDDCRYRDPGLRDGFGAGGSVDGVAGSPGVIVSGDASDNALRTNPGGTTAVRIARLPDCSTLRLSKKVFTSASVPCGPRGEHCRCQNRGRPQLKQTAS